MFGTNNDSNGRSIDNNNNGNVSKIYPEARYFVSKAQHNVRYDFSSKTQPVLKVDQDDLVHVETNDCFHGMVQPDSLLSWEEKMKKNSINNDDYGGASSNSNGSSTSTSTSSCSILDEIPRSKRNPVTGPIYVNGARPGDILAVTLLDIRPKGIGVSCCGSQSGQLCHLMKKDSISIRFFDLNQCRTIVTMRDDDDDDHNNDNKEKEEEGEDMTNNSNESVENIITTDNTNSPNLQHPQQPPKRWRQRRLGPISFPASPMLGVIGVAPSSEDEDPIGTIPAGKHGGNLDNNCNGIGSTIYLPINHPGALLSIGDMHASQGDGEIAGTGVEIGGDVLLKCRVIKQEDVYGKLLFDDDEEDETIETSSSSCNNSSKWKLEYPVTETATHWITHGVFEGDIPKTTSIACTEAAKILVTQWGFTIEESFIFLSVKGDLGLCQACNPDVGTQIAKMSVPKVENVCPRPFRVLMPQRSPSS